MLAGVSNLIRGEQIRYSVRRSARARRVRVNVRAHTEVEVVLPARAPDRAAAEAVRELAPWIERRLAEGRRALAQVAERGDCVPYLGRTLTLVRQPGRTRARLVGEDLLVPVGDHRPAVETLFRRLARAEVKARLDRAVASVELSYAALSIRSQIDALGVLLGQGRHELQLAPAAGPRAGARLRRLARGLPPGDPRPLPALLGAGGAPLSRLARAARLAAALWGDAGAVGLANLAKLSEL